MSQIHFCQLELQKHPVDLPRKTPSQSSSMSNFSDFFTNACLNVMNDPLQKLPFELAVGCSEVHTSTHMGMQIR